MPSLVKAVVVVQGEVEDGNSLVKNILQDADMYLCLPLRRCRNVLCYVHARKMMNEAENKRLSPIRRTGGIERQIKVAPLTSEQAIWAGGLTALAQIKIFWHPHYGPSAPEKRAARGWRNGRRPKWMKREHDGWFDLHFQHVFLVSIELARVRDYFEESWCCVTRQNFGRRSDSHFCSLIICSWEWTGTGP